MRKIKFRCWYDNRMHKVVSIDFTYKKINLFGADIINFEDGILMQYTGIKDKNGKEIYEGDIVKVFVMSEYIKGYIKYNEERGRFDVGWDSEIEKYKNNNSFLGSCSTMKNDYDELEVLRKYLGKSRIIGG